MAICKLCGIEIEFVRTAKGKLAPINVKTGKTHFGDCPVYLAQRKAGYAQSSFEDMAAPKPETRDYPG
jgi:fumarate hydratase class II